MQSPRFAYSRQGFFSGYNYALSQTLVLDPVKRILQKHNSKKFIDISKFLMVLTTQK